MIDPKIIDLRVKTGKEVTGNPEFSANDYAGLDPQTKIKITNAMKAEIAANPEEYSETQVKIAKTPEIGDIEEFTFGDAVKSAGEGAAKGAFEFGGNLKMLLTLAALASGAVAVIKLVELVGKKK